MQDVHSRSAGRARCDCEHGNLLTFEDGRIPPTGEGPFMTRLLCGGSLLKSLFTEESGQALRSIFRKGPRPRAQEGGWVRNLHVQRRTMLSSQQRGRPVKTAKKRQADGLEALAAKIRR